MSLKKRKNRFVGASILFLTLVLAVGSLMFAQASGSYTLLIQKVFADGTPEEAKNQEFTFRVEAQVKSGDGYTPEEKIVKIKGDGRAEVEFSNAFKISVIEQTDGGDFKVDGKDWNVVKTECMSSMHVGASQATVNISKDNGKIEITRPVDVPDVTFQLTGKPLHGTQEEFDEKFTPPAPVTISAGETKVLDDNLPQGEYTITKLRAADGFNVLVGSREFDVAAGKTGTVHINGNSSSKLLITAPEADGSPRTHYYNVSGYSRSGDWVSRDIDVRSGETGTVDNLDEGTYTIKVSKTYAGIEGYKVTFPELKETADRTAATSALYTESSGNYKTFSVKNDADYVEVYGFGPLQNSAGKGVSGSYRFYFGTRNPETGKIASRNALVSATKIDYYTLESPRKLLVSDGKVYFLALNVSNANAKKLVVKWKEYTEKETEKEIKNPEDGGDLVEIDSRGWITLSKPEDPDDPGKKVVYTYTIADSDGNDVRTVELHAGESVTVEGLFEEGDKKGDVRNFRIKEYAAPLAPMPFHVKLEDTSKSVTTTGGTIGIETLDARTVEISRPGKPEDDGGRLYTYKITKDGDEEFVRTVALKSGETKTVAEATGSMLPAGKYWIAAVDDQIAGFDVKFTDSSSLTSDYISSAAVTFTNHFAKVEASYHVIHEYYLENSDGSYTFEGASPVFTKNCDGGHDEGDGHYSKDVHLLDVYGGNTYTHFDDAYGKVVSWEKGGTPKNVELEDEDNVENTFNKENTDEPGNSDKPGNSWTGSNGSGTEEDLGTREYAYKPLTNLKCAMATPHDHSTGAHDHGAQIIILRYSRKDTPIEHGKYNIIHVYYQRTSHGDVWEGNRELETVDVGRLTDGEDGNRYQTYDAGGVERQLRFQPKDSNVEYPYVYDGAAYGRIVDSTNHEDYTGEGFAGEGKEYLKDDTMTSVKATTAGDEIIILRYYRSGGYNVVHEYYYREKAEQVEDSGSTEELPDDNTGTEGGSNGQDGESRTRDGEDGGFSGTLSDSNGYAYEYEGSSAIASYSDNLESRHDAEDVLPENTFQPVGDTEHEYVFNDAVYGYLDKETGTYRVAPYMTGVTATAQEDEIIILRYYRELPKVYYKIVHEYYLRDADGDHWEGATDTETVQGEQGATYTVADVSQKKAFKPKDATVPYEYTYDKSLYGVMADDGQDNYGDHLMDYKTDPSWTSVEGTEDASQIIVLRYYREVKPDPEGSYKVVHEYYLHTPEGDELEGRSEIANVPVGTLDEAVKAAEHTESGVIKEEQPANYFRDGTSVENTHRYTYESAAYGNMNGVSYAEVAGMNCAHATEEGNEIIILRYYREVKLDPEGSYKVIHEYYLRDAEGDHWEGTTGVTPVRGELDNTYTAEKDVELKPQFISAGMEYTYEYFGTAKYGVLTDSNQDEYGGQTMGYQTEEGKTSVTATEAGEQIIILRYYRKVKPDPEGSYKVIHEYYLRDAEGDHWEGTTGVTLVRGELDNTYTAEKDVELKPQFISAGMEYTYEYFGTAKYGVLTDSNQDEYGGQTMGYQTEEGKTSVTATEAGEQIIILRYYRDANTPPPVAPEGSLEVQKTVEGTAGDRERDWHFTITLTGPGVAEVTGQFGDMTFASGTARFTLKHGETKRATGLPAGLTYSVTEDESNQAGYVTTPNNANGAIQENAAATVQFTNAKDTIPGSLEVQKTVEGTAGDREKDWHFTVTLTGPGAAEVTGQFGDMTFASGTAQFTLKHGETKRASGLPAGLTYSVTEDEANQAGYVTTPSNASGAIQENAAATVQFTNAKDTIPGSLEVQKTVEGTAGDREKDWHFTVTLTGPGAAEVTGQFGDMTFASGTARFTLKHGETKRATGLPAGLAYSVTEDEANRDGYVTTPSNAAGAIQENAVAKAQFTNRLETGSVKISKWLQGDNLTSGDYAQLFHFTVTILDAKGTFLGGSFAYTDGAGQELGRIPNGGGLSLCGGQSVFFNGLPAGSQCIVVETPSSGWTVDVPEKQVTVDVDSLMEIGFINSKAPDNPPPPPPDDPPPPDNPPPDNPPPPPPDNPPPDDPPPDNPPPDAPPPDNPPPDDPPPDNPPPDDSPSDNPPPDDPPPGDPPPVTPPDDPMAPPPDIPNVPDTPDTPEPPEEPVAEEHPTELPDPNDPDAPELITIWVDGVPKTYKKIWDPEKEEWVYVLDEEPPLANLDLTPPTGDLSHTGLWALLNGLSLAGAVAVLSEFRKKKDK